MPLNLLNEAPKSTPGRNSSSSSFEKTEVGFTDRVIYPNAKKQQSVKFVFLTDDYDLTVTQVIDLPDGKVKKQVNPKII